MDKMKISRRLRSLESKEVLQQKELGARLGRAKQRF